MIRPVQTVRAQQKLYHLTCWRERRPTGKTPKAPKVRAAAAEPTIAEMLHALYRPDSPLSREKTTEILLAVPGLPGWIHGRLGAPKAN